MNFNENELREKIRPIMETMVFDLVCNRPANPVKWNFIKSKFLGSIYDKLATKKGRIYS